MSRIVVRIVKRGQGVQRGASRIHDPRSTVLEMERTVKSWVDEVRSKQETDSRLVFSKLFGRKM